VTPCRSSQPPRNAPAPPELVDDTNDILLGDIWERPGPRERSLATVSVLAALYRSEQLPHHLFGVALENGLSIEELPEAITHLASYAGRPNAMTAITQLKKIADERAL
jgi:4-carboxymuconolactone decarboxylase